jgi:hypothetical protein
MTKVHIFTLFIFGATTACANGLLVSQTGEWGATCPAVVCSAPGDSWSYSFQTDSELSLLRASPTSTITDFAFFLNGIQIATLNNAYVNADWFVASDDGGFDLGPQSPILFGRWTPLFAFTTLPFEATLVPGVYPVQSFSAFSQCMSSCLGWETFFGTTDFVPNPVVITNTPEPASLILVATMLVGMTFVVRKRIAWIALKRNKRKPQTFSVLKAQGQQRLREDMALTLSD